MTFSTALLLLAALGVALAIPVLRERRSRALRLQDEADACALWDEAHPTNPATSAMLSSTGQAALVRHCGGLGLLWPMGSQFAARRITAGALHFDETPRHLVVIPQDAGAPRIRLALTADERPVWRAALETLTP